MTENLKTFLVELKKLQDQYDVKFVVMPKGVIEVRDNSATVCFNRTIVPSKINDELKKLKGVVNMDYNLHVIEAKTPTDIECQFSLSDFKNISGLCYTWNNEHTDKNNFILFECAREKKFVYIKLFHCYDRGESAEILDERQYDISTDTDKTLKIKVVKKEKSKWYKLDVTEIEPEPVSNEEIWDEVFKKLDEEEKKYIETDLSPWLTETYSEDEKKEYLELKAKAMHMSREEIYDNVGKHFGIWWRISREELRRRDTNKYRKPKNPPQEYYEPEGCPECGCDLEEQDDGNYHCMCCGYDHNRDRNGYCW